MSGPLNNIVKYRMTSKNEIFNTITVHRSLDYTTSLYDLRTRGEITHAYHAYRFSE